MGIFSFPNPVNEVSARVVAAGVVLLSVLAIGFQLEWLLPVVAYGFLARVLTGPTLSPLGQLATRVITPRLPVEPRPVPGPPKRFAQGMGAAISSTALVLYFFLGLHTAGYAVLGLVTAAALESALGFCVGCRVFALLMRLNLVPERVCAECADLRVAAR